MKPKYHIGVCLPYIRLIIVVKPKYHNGVCPPYVCRMSATIFGTCSPYVRCMFAVCPPYFRRISADHLPYIRRMSPIYPPYVCRMSSVYPPYLIAHFPGLNIEILSLYIWYFSTCLEVEFCLKVEFWQ